MIEYKFKDSQLLKQALTHSSVDGSLSKNYERLEFLGDRVLGICVANLMYQHFPNEPEGSLSQRYTGLVCKETVSKVAKKLGLNRDMIVIGNELRTNENVLCDIAEAVIGAIFIDGGFLVAQRFVEKHWQGLINEKIAPPKDAKTCLQELLHSQNFPIPKYEMVSKSGSEHEPIFEIAIRVSGLESVSGFGKNKKLAEFEAASKMLDKLQNKDNA